MRNESYSEWNPYRGSKIMDILNKFQEDPRGPKGAFEGMGPWGHLRLFRRHFECKQMYQKVDLNAFSGEYALAQQRPPKWPRI